MIKERLEKLRKLLKQHDFDGYIVPSVDEYLSEYTPDYAKRLEYITGFTGSNGIAVILKDTVLFFTDGRYINQGFRELDDHLFEIFDLSILPNFNWSDYISSSETIFYDPKLLTKKALLQFGNLKTRSYQNNLIDKIWDNQPEKPNSEIYDYDIKYAGTDYKNKISKSREFLSKHEAQNLIISDSDSICWLLNIRAHDVEFSPLLLAYAIVTKEQVFLFTDKKRFAPSLDRDELIVFSEDEFFNTVNQLSGLTIFDQAQSSTYLSEIMDSKKHKKLQNPIMNWKSCKNDVEISHAQQAHIEDAVAVCEILSFISNNDVSHLTEHDICKKLTTFRSAGKNYCFDSFPTICGYQENGAVIHYRASEETSKTLKGEGLLLIDSGGQYNGATTDVTRTTFIGKTTYNHKKYYTKVLKGHIALARSVFPENKISGAHLDILARQYLWQNGDDYAHGTGHGVGSFLSVHEGPINISPFGFNSKLQKGMIISNEPGYYKDGDFGIRIENLVYVKQSKVNGFLEFDNLTLIPYEKDLIDQEQLTEEEISYLKNYYTKINELVTPLLSDQAKNWMEKQIDFLKK